MSDELGRLVLLPGGMVYVPYKYDPGGTITRAGDYSQQIFTFILGATGEQYHFDIGKLTRQVLADPSAYYLLTATFRKRDIDRIIGRNGIELPHLESMTPERLDTPGLLIWWPDGTQAIVDGNHRAVARWRQGRKSMDFCVVTLEQSKPCLLDIPDHIGSLEVNGGPIR